MDKENQALQRVQRIRYHLPRLGVRKVHHLLKQERFDCGRDWLFGLLRERGMLVSKQKRYVYTTHSNHRFRVYQNKYKHTALKTPNQVWVSDITYLKTKKGFCYASLITDAYSRKIVGYHVHDTLEQSGTITALNTALRQHGSPQMHHSDRGSQYCSKKYTTILKNKGVVISMTQDGNCYDNALAERINGILKDEFLLNQDFQDVHHARQSLKQAVNTYNKKRPHLSLNFKTPEEIHNIV